MFGPKAHENAHLLLDNNVVGFMGSDAHNLRHRNTDLKSAREKIVKHWGESRAIELLETRPRYILGNKALPPELYIDGLPSEIKRKKPKKTGRKGIFSKLFR